MPRYEYRCRACGDTFEVSRPMSAAGEATSCPQGHDDTVKLLSAVAVTGRAGTGRSVAPAPGSGSAPRPPVGGGCCGGGCAC